MLGFDPLIPDTCYQIKLSRSSHNHSFFSLPFLYLSLILSSFSTFFFNLISFSLFLLSLLYLSFICSLSLISRSWHLGHFNWKYLGSDSHNNLIRYYQHTSLHNLIGRIKKTFYIILYFFMIDDSNKKIPSKTEKLIWS